MQKMTRMQLAAAVAMELAGGPYVFAATGQICTPSLRKSKMQAKPAYADKIKRYCPALTSGRTCGACKYDGMRAFDCRGLTYWALKQAGLKISSIGSTTQWTTDSWQERGTIDNLPRDKPAILFKQDADNPQVMAHTGFALGDGTAVDARGHARGVVIAGVDDYPWTHWAIPYRADEESDPEDPDYSDDGEAVTSTRPYLRKGAKGEDVRYMQTALIALGHPLPRYGADGSYGAETQAAVTDFQLASGLDPDGICGPKTWHALETRLAGSEAETPQEEEPLYTVTVRNLTAEQADLLMAIYDDAARAPQDD